MQVQELMNEPAVTCLATDTVNQAATLMWEKDCGAIPVVNDDGSLIGMITDRDICMAAYTQGKRLDDIKVSAAMANKVFSCHRYDSVESAEKLMSDKQIRRLPIVDSAHRPVGMLSLNDIARYAASSRTNGRLNADVTRTLAAICSPREHAPAQQPYPSERPAM